MKANNMKQQVADEMLDEMVEICLSETDTISLLDIPTTSVSEDANDADAIKWVTSFSCLFSLTLISV